MDDPAEKTNGTLTIGEVAARSGLNEPTIRYYEKIGLIELVGRDFKSHHRRYSEKTVEKIEALACLRAAGMPLEDMRRYLRNMRSGQKAAAEQRKLFERHADRIDEEIKSLKLRQKYLAAKVKLWSAREHKDQANETRAIKELSQLAKKLRNDI